MLYRCLTGIWIRLLQIVLLWASNLNFGTEAATRGALWKELFLKISQFWQENNLECLFSKVAGLQANSIKTRRQRRCFPVNIAKFLRTPILKNVCKRVRRLHYF